MCKNDQEKRVYPGFEPENSKCKTPFLQIVKMSWRSPKYFGFSQSFLQSVKIESERLRENEEKT